ncbi:MULTISPECIES: VOC family protein [unclassified Chelatococcus]|jgi:predicted enzyme related to lactoylglutathione lyase|uniref:VOC family protein n=1 Tax=unclassified Chelatococcus TaxID=2638111 RepID=UPI001BCCA877|nr:MULTISPECIES: VOC family protein [unclassified Chelatococcus]CAH1659089.1 VOC family protein [Hyphomicrobiales bacterium]MBS7740892.1 VOC family protein [Chelatococcus sp. HY11]MBX3546817.1 VOC family protein [Chelatococcus sp.]MCO5077710.1 VOC family protein [Chelatococcus sp.]CAH1683930.1 VOC family protein [Hyphomicrobiales bacterium]
MRLLVNIDVPDLTLAVAFYTAAFGLTPGRRLGKTVVELDGGQVPIYLLEKGPGTVGAANDHRRYERHWTPIHLDVPVDDIEIALARAIAAGATLESGITSAPWGKIAICADPFGHGFCLIEFLNRGYDEIAGSES